jgi:hypothetical protein
VSLPVNVFGSLVRRPCLFGDLPALARAHAGGRAVAILPTEYGTRVIFAEHCACRAVAMSSFVEADREDDVAIVLAERGAAPPPGWCEVASRRSWALYERQLAGTAEGREGRTAR